MEVPVGHLTVSGRRVAFPGVVHNDYQSRLRKPHPAPPFPQGRERKQPSLLLRGEEGGASRADGGLASPVSCLQPGGR